MNLSTFVADFLAEHTTGRIYAVCGSAAMYLNDAFCHHPKLKVMAMHHEQACAFAAEADARVSGNPAIVHVTGGPGGTNAITGIAAAYIDSIPMIVIAGQVTSSTMGYRALRQLGCNEVDLVGMCEKITKYAVTVRDPKSIQYTLQQALYLATSGRPGPVLVEIPLDVQMADIEPSNLLAIYHDNHPKRASMERIKECLAMLAAAHRPLMIVGNGVRIAGAQDKLTAAIDQLKIPVVTSWEGADLLDWDNGYAIGRPGLMGDRAGNFAVQNADVILAIGTRLSIPQTGHAPDRFAPNAKIIMVDIDREETQKPTLDIALAIVSDAGEFIDDILASKRQFLRYEWLARCQAWKERYPVMQPQYRDCKDGINSYYFMEELAKHLDDDAIVVTGAGAAFLSAHQSLKLNGRQRLIYTAGLSPMGYDLPAAIGAWRACEGKRQVVCLTGDGGIMMNLQELATIAHHEMPIKTFVFENNGYMTMQYTQANHFKREAVSSPQSGVSFPEFDELNLGFAVKTDRIGDVRSIKPIVQSPRPWLVAVDMPPSQLLAPRIQAKSENGKFIPAAYEDMYPYLDRDELAANIVFAISTNPTATGT